MAEVERVLGQMLAQPRRILISAAFSAVSVFVIAGLGFYSCSISSRDLERTEHQQSRPNAVQATIRFDMRNQESDRLLINDLSPVLEASLLLPDLGDVSDGSTGELAQKYENLPKIDMMIGPRYGHIEYSCIHGGGLSKEQQKQLIELAQELDITMMPGQQFYIPVDLDVRRSESPARLRKKLSTFFNRLISRGVKPTAQITVECEN